MRGAPARGKKSKSGRIETTTLASLGGPWYLYSAPSLEADKAPRMFRSINSTSALSPGIWISVPESGRREGLGNQGGGTNSIDPMEQWQLEVWAHA